MRLRRWAAGARVRGLSASARPRSSMSLRRTAARTVGGMITVIRIPADMSLSLVGHVPLGGVLRGAVESADANVRNIAGWILGSDELYPDGAQRRRVVPD